MANRFFGYMRYSASYLWLVPAAAYLGVSAAQAALHNYTSQQQTQSLRQQLAAAQTEHDRLEAVVVYYQTDNFKEKELRRALLMVRPGERVYALPESSGVHPLEDTTVVTSASSSTKKTKSDLPYWRQWVDYLLK